MDATSPYRVNMKFSTDCLLLHHKGLAAPEHMLKHAHIDKWTTAGHALQLYIHANLWLEALCMGNTYPPGIAN